MERGLSNSQTTKTDMMNHAQIKKQRAKLERARGQFAEGQASDAFDTVLEVLEFIFEGFSREESKRLTDAARDAAPALPGDLNDE